MGLVLDSSVLVAAERGRLDLDRVLAERADEDVAIAAITASELLHGVHRAATPAQRARREAFVEQLLAGLPVLPFDLVVARVHARLWADLLGRGQAVGAHDLQIAATALASGMDVASRDRRSFPRIPGIGLVVL
jgi:tRNA(fMet)-specific endonuclease VapC